MEVSELAVLGWGFILGFGFAVGMKIQDLFYSLVNNLGSYTGDRLAKKKNKSKESMKESFEVMYYNEDSEETKADLTTFDGNGLTRKEAMDSINSLKDLQGRPNISVNDIISIRSTSEGEP